MRKVILLCGLIATISVSFGWPTVGEIEKVKPVVEELMAARADARPEDAAVVALEFADKAETEAAKFMLFYRAVKFYAKAGDDANVEQTFLKMKEVVKDIPATVQEQILIEAGRAISKKNRKPERTEVLCRGVRVVVWAEKELIAAQKILKAPQKEFTGTKKDVPAAHLQAGNAFAVLGDWPKALEHLCATDGKLARVAEHEINGTASVDKLANAWWKAMALVDVEYVKNAYRSHSAELYRKALESDLLTGLNKTLAESRIAEAEKMENVVSGRGNDPEGGKTSSGSRLYCVVDLSAGFNAEKYQVSYRDAPPNGGWTDEYKTTKLVLRRIEAASFKMGGVCDVTLTKPYYIGIFEVTQKQYELIAGNNPSHFKGDMRPVEQVSYNDLRGRSKGAAWPSSPEVDSDSFIGKLQTRTGLAFDLPTEAEWEYACRSGASGIYGNGGDTENDLALLGRYVGNMSDGEGGYSEHTTVGSYMSNIWGLYDMHGNVYELCLDWNGKLSNGVVDPKGAPAGRFRINRGGCWDCSPRACSSFHRANINPNIARSFFGFRLKVSLAE